MHSRVLKPDLGRLEKKLPYFFLKSLGDIDLISVWKKVFIELILLLLVVLSLQMIKSVLVKRDLGDLSKLFLDCLDDLELGTGVHADIAQALNETEEVFGHVSTSQVDSLYSVLYCVSIDHRDNLSNSISYVTHNTSVLSLGIETQHCGVFKENAGHAESLKEDFCNFGSVCKGIQASLGDQHVMVLRRDLQLCVHLLPHLFHVIPVLDHSMLHRVVELEETFSFVAIIANELILVILREHDLLVFRSAKYVLELYLRLFRASKTCFDDSRAIINDKRLVLTEKVAWIHD